MNPRELGRRVRSYFRSARAYALLDRFGETKGSTWTAGGCWLGAAALQSILDDSELWTLLDGDVPQHIVVRYEGYFIDADGASTKTELLSRWRQRERLRQPRLARGLHLSDDIVCPLGAVPFVANDLENAIRGAR